jgi:diphthine synthase
MLWIIGIGINGYGGISIEALDILKKCDKIYLERFTSPLSDNDIRSLNALIAKNSHQNDVITPVQRWFVEDGRELIEQSKLKNIALLTYGDPLIATTFTELHVRAVKRSIKVKIIHAASGITSVIGESGLHIYKFGRTVTMMSGFQSYISVYNTILDNLLAGNHTLVLTEYANNNDNLFFLDPTYFFERMLQAEEDTRQGAFTQDTFVIVASRVGTEQQRIESGKVKSLINKDYGTGPHSIIVTASLHFTELDAVKSLTVNLDEPVDNTPRTQNLSVNMIEKYAPKVKQEVNQMKSKITAQPDISVTKAWIEILDNAQYYTDDAERFLKQGKFELAILSMGYAEGLIDALRMQEEKAFDIHDTKSTRETSFFFHA